MVTLALGGWLARGTVAVSRDGNLLAAVDAGMVAGLRGAGLCAVPDPRLVATRCLAAAGLTWTDVEAVRLVLEDRDAGPWTTSRVDVESLARAHDLVAARVDTCTFDDGVQRFASALAAGAPVLYAGTTRAWWLAEGTCSPLQGYGDLVAATARLARALGLTRAVWAGLQELADGHVASEPWAAMLRPALAGDLGAIVTDRSALDATIARAAAALPVALDLAGTPHLATQHLRATLAASWLGHVGEVLERTAGAGAIRLAGPVGVLPAVAGRRLGGVLPCPDARAAVIGAAVGPAETGSVVRLQRIGEGFTESDVKLALESARLDYLYEPRPERLLDRVSALLSSGRLVGWFEGRTDIGDVPSGSRVVVADAADRYCRDNVNVYLQRRPVDRLLTTALTTTAAVRVFGERAPSPGTSRRLQVPPGHAAAFDGAVNRQGCVEVVAIDPTQAPGFHGLLAHHEQRTGHHALAVSPLGSPEGATAASPLDALASTFSTPVDALVMGRFVVFKDYWLLRSGLTPK